MGKNIYSCKHVDDTQIFLLHMRDMVIKLPLRQYHIIVSHHLCIKVDQLICIQLMAGGKNVLLVIKGVESMDQSRFMPA